MTDPHQPPDPDPRRKPPSTEWTEFFPRLTDRPLFDVRLLRSGPLLVFQFAAAPTTDEDPTWFSADLLFLNHGAAELAALHAVPADFDRACLDALAKVRDGSARTVCRRNREREP